MSTTVTEGARYELLADLRARYPESPFLALGQTVFWDEPMKAALRRLLDDAGLGGRMVVGVHDTDYFAKTRVRRSGQGRFELMAHNDGTTKDLWSAAGEVSTLFGSETFPSRHDYVGCGVPFDKVANASPMGRQAFLDEVTEAWGWRGLVYTGSRDLIVSSLSLREVGDGVLEMIGWGFSNAIEQIGPNCCRNEAQRTAEMILGWCREYREANPDRNLTDLFQHVLPQLYSLLLGRAPQDTTIAGTTSLLQFTPETAHLPRFKFVGLFLDPATREAAIDAYNAVVAGSTIYTLDKFGRGALPFDVISSQHGRGTLRVTPRVVFVETRQPIAIALERPVESLADLAEALHSRLGDDVTLVGKAVSLVSMLAQEFIFVFNEEGSMYVRRTRQMNDMLAQRGIPLDMRPILRMRYRTWSSLTAGSSSIRLPQHLAATFGRQTITAPEFAEQWQDVVAEQRALRKEIGTIRRPVQLLSFLQLRDPVGHWDERLADYNAASQELAGLHGQVEEIQAQLHEQYRVLKATKAQRLATQEAMGAHFRTVTEWSPAELERRAAFERELAALDAARRPIRAEIARLTECRRAMERSERAGTLRATLRRIELEAETARLNLVRNSFLTTEGLEHTNHRPSSWWLPLVDATSAWFNRIAETVELYTEPLLSQVP
jgi:hypothetical protein